MRIASALLCAAFVVACGVAAPAGSSPTAGPSLMPTDAQPTASPVPRGLLTADGEPVAGFQGSYCWQGLCADVFEMPPLEALPALATAPGTLSFSLDGPGEFVSWSASYGGGESDDLLQLGQGGAVFDPDTNLPTPPPLTDATFAAPPRGEWMVVVQVFFREGDAQYAWHVSVD